LAGPSDKPPHTLAPAAVAKRWGSELERGHSHATAAKLHAELGPNRLAEKPPPSFFSRFIAQVSDATVLALLVAAIVAAALGFFESDAGSGLLERFGDAIAILTIVVLNALLGMVQEKRAEKALLALRQMTNPVASVVRDGTTCEIPAPELVPGDVIRLQEGDRLPADARLARVSDLEVTEAALTGESMPVGKAEMETLPSDTPLHERLNMVYMGTEVTRGRATAIVTSIGMQTELGKVAGLLAGVEFEPTPLQRYLNRFGRQIVVACVAISAIVMLAGLLSGLQSLRDLFLTAVSLAVAAIPEGLPAITTIVLALGTQRMARRNALVRRLPAVEGLGSAEVICTDKTGTLTQNRMTVRRIYADGHTFTVSGAGDSPTGEFRRHSHQGESSPAVDPDAHEGLRHILFHAAHAPNVGIEPEQEDRLSLRGDPTEVALRVVALKGGIPLSHEPVVVKELPFSSSRKVGTLVIDHQGQHRALVRGAPEIVIARAQSVRSDEGVVELDPRRRAEWEKTAERWGAEAMRVVALATRDDPPAHPAEWEQGLTLVALVGIVDPPRPEVKPAIAEARRAGIRTMMITGDQQSTARAIAADLDLCDDSGLLLTGQQLDLMDQQTLEAQVDELSIVSRATPVHKLRIVEALKARGRVCAMTGDGVNDAPAVKAASIGVAMGRAGTEVTKEAADLVLADDNYTTIVSAVEEGRSIFSNIKKFIFFLLSSNAGIVLAVFASGLLGWAPPLAPIQILWINLVTNGLPALALGVEPKEPRLMARPPRDPKQPILGKRDYLLIVGVGVLMASGALGVFAWIIGAVGDVAHPDLRLAQTGCFAVLSLSPMFHAFNCRSAWLSNWRLGWFSNRALWGSVVVGVVLIATAVYVPVLNPVFRTEALATHQLLWIALVSAIPLLVVEVAKMSGLIEGRVAQAREPSSVTKERQPPH
jgi:Ca2+-transporting ATPase